MNVDNTSDSNLKQCTVRSKYFTSTSMDDSSSDFQDKKVLNVPKKVEKAKTKPKKPLKRLKGQKDIRTVLKKKNELIAYSNEFDKVCKQSGIDVDSEQLQLAIALSKSLQQTESNDIYQPSTSNSQERFGKIKTTLQEYGFKVPEIKITVPKKRLKVKKSYKLLLCSEEEKRQIITDKYSQVLFANSGNNITNKTYKVKSPLYVKATNISYNVIKSNTVFYVKELIQESVNTVGSLLRDWSEIPGRPSSPVLEIPKINFTDIEFTQEDLNIILSGSIKSAQYIIRKTLPEQSDDSIIMDTDEVASNNNKTDTMEELNENNKNVVNSQEVNEIEIVNLEVPQSISEYRSCSPDIFDDESTVLDKSNFSNLGSQGTVKNIDKASETIDLTNVNVDINKHSQQSDCMDLTECVNLRSQSFVKNDTMIGKSICLSGSNVTKRKSNDFMDITECVSSSQTGVEKQGNMSPIVESMDLTQSNSENDVETFNNRENIAVNDEVIEEQDVTITNVIKSGEKFANVLEGVENDEVASNSNECIIFQERTDDTSITQVDMANTHEISSSDTSKVKETTTDLTQTHNSKMDEIRSMSIEDDECVDSVDLTQNDIENKSSSKKSVDLTQSNIENERPSNEISPIRKFKGKRLGRSPTDSILGKAVTPNSGKKLLEISLDGNKSKSKISNFNNDPIVYEVADDSLILSSRNNDKNSHATNVEVFDNMDLTQSSSDDDTLPYVQITGKSSDNNALLNNSANTCNDVKKNDRGINAVAALDDSIEYVSNESPTDNFFNIDNNPETRDKGIHSDSNSQRNRDLTIEYQRERNSKTKSFFEEFSYRHSEEDLDLNSTNENEIPDDDNHSNEEILTSRSESYNQNDVNDLSQRSTEYETSEIEVSSQTDSVENLGKVGDISIDYDELFDNVLNNSKQFNPQNIIETEETNRDYREMYDLTSDHQAIDTNRASNVYVDDVANFRNNTEPEQTNSCVDFIEYLYRNIENNSHTDDSMNNTLPRINLGGTNTETLEPIPSTSSTYSNYVENEITNNLKAFLQAMNCQPNAPETKLVIRMDRSDPMIDYTSLSTPEMNKELKKYGIKPLKRRRAIQILTHIYNQTHPVVDKNFDPSSLVGPRYPKRSRKTLIDLKPDSSTSSEEGVVKDMFAVTNNPLIQYLDPEKEELFFEMVQRNNVHTCRVPLHITFHNMVTSRRRLRESILRYEPIEIDRLRALLRDEGFRYDVKDIVKFMDDKCITVKTQNYNNRNKRLLK